MEEEFTHARQKKLVESVYKAEKEDLRTFSSWTLIQRIVLKLVVCSMWTSVDFEVNVKAVWSWWTTIVNVYY